jgi:mannose-6-phosphate isomerase class I
VPKNEIQFRSRAGSITNLGTTTPADPKVMYKRFCFVDWVVLRKHAANLLPNIDLCVDMQRPDNPVFTDGRSFRASLDAMSRNYFRARPWFEPGAWGGQWIKKHIPELPQDAPNYAWSFELISPENGLMLRDKEVLLEVSFDFLMFHAHRHVLGASAERFGYEFPIRFDFLDTFDGGNLSVQCHPSPDYARQHFGENFTQDETYYILDCEPGAQVYVGFKDGIDRDEFRTILEDSFATGSKVDVERYVNSEAASQGDLFLIPHGTVHCAGVNNLVLEISATPYIFTFKMYDWMRLDLDGMPRPLNIARAFENLNFERQGARVQEELISKPRVIDSGTDWAVVHLPTHADHFYDVHRLEFSSSIDVTTDDSPHVLSLVEGNTVLVETQAGMSVRFSFAETFVIPAAARQYRLTSESGKPIKVVKGFMKS